MLSDLIFDVPLLLKWQQAMEEWLRLGTQLSRTAEAIAVVAIARGVLSTLFNYAIALCKSRSHRTYRSGETENISLQVGRTLSVGLEFLLAADILSTAVAPSWDTIGKLAAIATIGTLLNYFLGRELREEAHHRIVSPTSAPCMRLQQKPFCQDLAHKEGQKDELHIS